MYLTLATSLNMNSAVVRFTLILTWMMIVKRRIGANVITCIKLIMTSIKVVLGLTFDLESMRVEGFFNLIKTRALQVVTTIKGTAN